MQYIVYCMYFAPLGYKILIELCKSIHDKLINLNRCAQWTIAPPTRNVTSKCCVMFCSTAPCSLAQGSQQRSRVTIILLLKSNYSELICRRSHYQIGGFMETARMSVLANCFTMFAIFQFCHNIGLVFIAGIVPHLDNSLYPGHICRYSFCR